MFPAPAMQTGAGTLLLAAFVLLLPLPGTAAEGAGQNKAPAAAPTATKARTLTVVNKPRTGDFDTMLERRQIRVAVPYSRSLYFVDKGRERGIAAELTRDFERWLNQKHAKALGKRPLTVLIVATTRDRMLPDLNAGLVDIAAGNLTVTEDRKRIADFFAPEDASRVDEIVVTGPASPQISSVEDLSGKTVHVRRASSYYESLVALNARLAKDGKAPATLILVPDALEDEDMLEMMSAGLLQIMVVDDWKAKTWAQVLPGLHVNADVKLRDDGRIGWAIRKDSPQLAAEIADFYARWAKKTGVIPYRLKQYMASIKALKNPARDEDWKRFGETIALFRKYGAQYHFDPLMLVAQGYQESTLDQSKRSHVGAIGVMQVMPATGAELKVGDIQVTEANIHAGIKYLDQLMTRYFPDAQFDDANRPLFAFASYNCGPGNVARLRREAAKRGLDPDVWFNNVEIVTAEKIGIETTTYVRNIFKYYVSYRLATSASETAEKLKREVAPAKS